MSTKDATATDEATEEEVRRAGRLGARTLLALLAVAVAALVLAYLVVIARTRGGAVHRFEVRFDDSLNRYAHRHHGAVDAWTVVTDVGGPTTWRVLAGIAAIVLWLRHRRRLALLVAVTMAGAALLSGLVKAVVHRARPVVPEAVTHAGGGSFPSGHALTSFTAVALAVVLLAPRLRPAYRAALVVVGALIVLAVGFSRLFLGVHYVTDVLGGWLIGALWLAAVLAAFRRFPGG